MKIIFLIFTLIMVPCVLFAEEQSEGDLWNNCSYKEKSLMLLAFNRGVSAGCLASLFEKNERGSIMFEYCQKKFRISGNILDVIKEIDKIYKEKRHFGLSMTIVIEAAKAIVSGESVDIEKLK